MGFSIPGAFAAKLLYPEKKVLAVCGDGGFMMNSQELETAVREKVPFVTLIWEDSSYGSSNGRSRSSSAASTAT